MTGPVERSGFERTRGRRLRAAVAASLAAGMLVVAGCGPQPAADGGHEGHHHHHGEHADYGPHGGLLVEWERTGAKSYHVELVADRAKQEATVYLMDEELTKASPVDAKTIVLEIRSPQAKIALTALPQDGDPAGSSSRFVGKDAALGGETPLAGAVAGQAAGMMYYGSFDEAKAKKPVAKQPNSAPAGQDKPAQPADAKDAVEKDGKKPSDAGQTKPPGV